MVKLFCSGKTFPLLPKGNYLTVFTIEAARVLCNRHWFTKPRI